MIDRITNNINKKKRSTLETRPNVFISYSYGTDEIIATSLSETLNQNGYEVFDHEEIKQKLICWSGGLGDLSDLKQSYRRAGLDPTKQEQADPTLFSHLITTLAKQHILIILWSNDYAQKFWTRIEWKTSMAMSIPTLTICMDEIPLDQSLRRASLIGKMPVMKFGQDYSSTDVVDILHHFCDFNNTTIKYYIGEEIDAATGLIFVRLKHPLLGIFGISKYVLIQSTTEKLWSGLLSRIPYSESAANEPLTHVSWPEACELCVKMTELSSEFRYRLPTEIEWEFAARAGEKTLSGLPNDDFSSYAVLGRDKIAPVGSLKPNAWGLYDVIGNVLEWTSDPMQFFEYMGWINPVNPQMINDQLYGAYAAKGAWFGGDSSMRSSASYSWAESSGTGKDNVGIRIVREKKRKNNSIT